MTIQPNPEEIDVILLCGGLGKRLRSIISDRPKPMAEITNRPFLDILIDYVTSFRFRRFILCIGYMGDRIKQYYENKDDSLTILFSEEKELLGTAGAIKNAKLLIQSSPFLVMNGDSFCQVNLGEFLNFHVAKHSLLSIVLVTTDKTKDYGVVNLGDSQRIIGFNEKIKVEGNSFINAGIYLFERDVLSMIPSKRNYSLEYELFPKMVNKDFYGYVTEETLIDIGTKEGYKKAQQIFEMTGGLYKIKI